MAGPISFDSFDETNGGEQARPSKPIWKLIKDDAPEKDIHNWLISEQAYLRQKNKERFGVVQRNLARYKGLQYLSQEIRERVNDGRSDNQPRRKQKIVVNHSYDLVQQGVSRLIKYRPAVSILPTNDEFKDKIGAKMCKSLLSHIWYVQRFEGVLQPNFVKYTKTMGESFLAILWDKDAGDDHHEFSEDYKGKIENGETIEVDDGEGGKVKIDKPIKNGDVKYDVWSTLDVLLEDKERFEKVNYLFHQEVWDLYEAQEFFGNKESIQEDSTAEIYDYEKMTSTTQKGKVVINCFYHKYTFGLKKGACIYFTSKGIIKRDVLGYSHGKLPCIPLVDIDLPGELHGHSGLENVSGLIGCYNNLTNSTVENIVMCGRPKWALPAGSAKKEDLGNAITIVEFKGPNPPQLLSMSPTPPEIYKFRDELKNEFREIYGSAQISRGEPPPGIKAGIALQYLGEQESERNNESILRYNEAIRQISEMTLAVCGDYYDEDDKRLIRVLGKDNKWMSIFFDVQHLSSDYDIRVQNSSALPQSKAARLQTLIDLNQQFPAQVTGEQVLDMIDLAQDEKFMSQTTKSVRAAQAENEQMLDDEIGKPVIEPEEYEDHIQHWREHVGVMRDWAFKNQTPKPYRGKIASHVMAHEMLMTEKAKQNPAYLEKLMTLEGFPLLFDAGLSGDQSGVDTSTQSLDQMAGIMQQGLGPIAPEEQLDVDMPGEPVKEQIPNLEGQEANIQNELPPEQPLPTGAI